MLVGIFDMIYLLIIITSISYKQAAYICWDLNIAGIVYTKRLIKTQLLIIISLYPLINYHKYYRTSIFSYSVVCDL